MTTALASSHRAPSLRFAWRELRGGLRGFYVFIACIALGVMAIAGVGSFARAQEVDFLGFGFALDQRERYIAAEQRAALARQTFAEARRDRADAGNRHHAERDAGDENLEAAQAAAQFAQGITERQ